MNLIQLGVLNLWHRELEKLDGLIKTLPNDYQNVYSYPDFARHRAEVMTWLLSERDRYASMLDGVTLQIADQSMGNAAAPTQAAVENERQP